MRVKMIIDKKYRNMGFENEIKMAMNPKVVTNQNKVANINELPKNIITFFENP